MVLSARRRSRGFGRGAHDAAAVADGDAVAPIQFRLDAGEATVYEGTPNELHGRGYTISDPNTGTPLGEDDFFFKIGGGFVTDLLDPEQHADELQHQGFGPGRSLRLVRHDPTDPDAPPVVDVFDASGTFKAGRLPADVCDAIDFYGGDTYRAAFCLWEWRRPNGPRVSLRLLLAPGWTVEELPAQD